MNPTANETSPATEIQQPMFTPAIIPSHQNVIHSRSGRFEKRPYKAAPQNLQLKTHNSQLTTLK
ncbi:hypothetical protein [uncultured Duncaniella sp.]|uniref:hypothetical protein n=1 Tax=uncultured Duncaniella sp. TaxID=2768039 RepID=UPI0026229C9D|nr:hypothetical protein [uncultured Duncaniella sp.]